MCRGSIESVLVINFGCGGVNDMEISNKFWDN